MSFAFGFDLKSLEMFVEVVRYGSMTAAAQRLNITQSSISQSLANLEKSLDTTLFDRSVRPMQITATGRYFYNRCNRILKEARETTRDLQAGQIHQPLQVRIAMVDSMASAFGKPLMNTAKVHSDDWSINTGLSHIHAQSLLAHDVDIIISDDAVMDSNELIRYPLFREPLLLVTPADYPFQPENIPRMAQELEMLRYPAHSLIGKTVEYQLRRLQLEPANRFQLDNTFAIINMVASGHCWTITTPLCLYQCRSWAKESIAVHLLPTPMDFRELTLVSRRYDLWTLPKDIANDSRLIFRDQIIPELIDWIPKIQPHISVSEPVSSISISRGNTVIS